MDPNFENLSTAIADLMRTKGISVEKLAQATGISDRHIELLIEGHIDKLPASPYLHGYILKIGDVLGFDGEELWELYARQHSEIRRSGEKDTLPKNRFEVPKIAKKHVVIGIIILFVVLYVAFRMPYIIGKPELSIDNIPDNLIVDTYDFIIRGSVNPNDELTINGEVVYPNSAGEFDLTVKLVPGFNTFKIMAHRSLGGESMLTKQIFYRLPESVATTSQTL